MIVPDPNGFKEMVALLSDIYSIQLLKIRYHNQKDKSNSSASIAAQIFLRVS
jgi:NRPS condensation-like uncharacterized protein